jgi:hypothetical protein
LALPFLLIIPSLRKSYNFNGRSWVRALPVIFNHDFIAEYHDYPQATLRREWINLREAPSFDAPVKIEIYNYISRGVAIQGRTSHDFEGWAYVILLESGVSGWIYDPADNSFLDYQGRATVPLIDAP